MPARPDPATPSRLFSNVTLVTAALNRDGKILTYHVHAMHATEAVGAAPGLRAEFLLPFNPPANATTLRLLVRDTDTGHIGSTDLPLH